MCSLWYQQPLFACLLWTGWGVCGASPCVCHGTGPSAALDATPFYDPPLPTVRRTASMCAWCHRAAHDGVSASLADLQRQLVSFSFFPYTYASSHKFHRSTGCFYAHGSVGEGKRWKGWVRSLSPDHDCAPCTTFVRDRRRSLWLSLTPPSPDPFHSCGNADTAPAA
jgi:hypothetical protein